MMITLKKKVMMKKMLMKLMKIIVMNFMVTITIVIELVKFVSLAYLLSSM